MDKNAKKVAYLQHQKSGCLWYRIKRPMDALRDHGIPTEIIELEKDIPIDEIQSIQFYGAYPFSTEKVLKFLKEKGIKIVYDMDDALHLVEESNPFFYAVKRDLGSVQEILDYADEVTVSTPKFIETLKGKTNAKITVVPNCYTPGEWTFERPQREGIRIGFAGSSSHVADLIEILPIIKRLQDKYNVKFLIMGFGKDDYNTWFKQFRYISTEKGIEELNKLDKLLSEIVFEWVPFVDFDIYPQVLTNMALDFGICPINNTPFNNHRSCSKAYEYVLSGALAIASDAEPYNTEPSSVVTNDWESVLEYYIQNPDKRNEKYTEQLKWVLENRNINNIIDLLKSVYVV